jgi:hypothetical protein
MQNMEKLGVLELHDYTLEPLKANAAWVSKADSSLETGRIVGLVFSNVSGTIYVEQSGDGLSWDVTDSFSVTGGSGLGFTVEKIAEHARVRYVNGAADQAVFRLYVYRRVRVI